MAGIRSPKDKATTKDGNAQAKSVADAAKTDAAKANAAATATGAVTDVAAATGASAAAAAAATKGKTDAAVTPRKPTMAERLRGATKAPTAVTKALVPPKPRAATKVKRARLRVTRLDPLSVLRTSFLFAMATAIILFTVVAVVWAVLSVSGALESIQKILDSVVGSGDGVGATQLSRYLETWRVLGFTALISIINVVLLTLLGTVTAYLYNLAASIYGGIEVTLAEDTH
ncbi:MAG: DUF3566 domain-containing protein [Propionibacteriaceae bacterium]|nr:DUF3566 domain-containing protein [Propionibacteriaceae bacterium]